MNEPQANAQMDERRHRVAALYLEGNYMSKIASIMGISHATVSRDISFMRRRWIAESKQSMDMLKAKELSKVDHLEEIYWQAWMRSQQDVEEVTVEDVTGPPQLRGNAAAVAPIAVQVAIKKREIRKLMQRDGSAAFLSGIQWCVDKRCEILGLNAPRRVAGGDGGPVVFRVVYGDAVKDDRVQEDNIGIDLSSATLEQS